MRKVIFADENYYHVYNRGVDKRQIFMDDDDRYRFMHNLWEFNDENYAPPFLSRSSVSVSTLGLPKPNGLREPKSRILLVDIVCFCLMPNHFHLLLRQVKDGGISLFMRKIGMGYANYFNLKYERSGALFQGRFKAKHVDNDGYLMQLAHYIHLNSVDLTEPDWRKNGLKDSAAAHSFLKNYKWSSYLDFIGIKNYPSLIKNGLLMDMVGGEKSYERAVSGAMTDDISVLKNYLIE